MNFIKMSALGNDYVYIDMEENKNLSIEKIIPYIPKLSDRNNGIGSDGVIFIYKNNNDICTRIFNKDGSEAEMCGNGLRCVARIVFDKKYVKDNEFYINLNDKKIKAFVNKDSVTIDMGEGFVKDSFELIIENVTYNIYPVEVPNPHAVIFYKKNIDSIDLKKIGPIIETSSIFPNKTNVEFINVVSDDLISMRVWERGSGETKACGSGACASALAAYQNNLVKDKVVINMPGGKALVSILKNAILLTGEANYVYTGQYKLI